MKTVYIAGPYKGIDWRDKVMNINNAEDAAIELWNAGFGVFCPHKNSESFDVLTDSPEQQFLDFDLRMLEACDIVCLLDGWRESAGARKEMRRAAELDKPIYHGVAAVIEAECQKQA